MVEFCLLLPVLFMLVLGMIQVSLIFINAMMVKYAAFMVARVVIVYDTKEEREKQAVKADRIISLMISYANSAEKNAGSGIMDAAATSAVNFLLDGIEGNRISVADEGFESSKGNFYRVRISYRMPLKVPVVNKMFVLLGKGGAGAVAARLGYPYYTINAASLMRVR